MKWKPNLIASNYTSKFKSSIF